MCSTELGRAWLWLMGLLVARREAITRTAIGQHLQLLCASICAPAVRPAHCVASVHHSIVAYLRDVSSNGGADQLYEL